jgi:hypothetical protein
MNQRSVTDSAVTRVSEPCGCGGVATAACARVVGERQRAECSDELGEPPLLRLSEAGGTHKMHQSNEATKQKPTSGAAPPMRRTISRRCQRAAGGTYRHEHGRARRLRVAALRTVGTHGAVSTVSTLPELVPQRRAEVNHEFVAHLINDSGDTRSPVAAAFRLRGAGGVPVAPCRGARRRGALRIAPPVLCGTLRYWRVLCDTLGYSPVSCGIIGYS